MITAENRNVIESKGNLVASLQQPGMASLDLSVDAVNQFWQEKDIRLSNILTVMESTEDWAFDGDNAEIESLLNKLCNQLNKQGNHFILNKISNDLLFILAYLHSGRAIRFIQWIDTRFTGMGLRLIQKAAYLANKESEYNEDFIEAKLMLDRVNTLKRVKHLSRIFSPVRMNMVIKALESINK